MLLSEPVEAILPFFTILVRARQRPRRTRCYRRSRRPGRPRQDRRAGQPLLQRRHAVEASAH